MNVEVKKVEGGVLIRADRGNGPMSVELPAPQAELLACLLQSAVRAPDFEVHLEVEAVFPEG